MLLRKTVLTAFALLAAPAMAAASPITWDFSGGGETLLQASRTFTSDGINIIATPYLQDEFCGDGGRCNDLFGKGSVGGGGDENGLGLTTDPSGDHEIAGDNFIQLDLSRLLSGYTSFGFSMNSTTDGEKWKACYSNSTGTFGSLDCTTGTNEGLNATIPSLPGKYLDFEADGEGDNVLLHTFTATATDPPVPEPASLLLLGSGLLAAGRRWRKRAN